jgi:hypothetical protein
MRRGSALDLSPEEALARFHRLKAEEKRWSLLEEVKCTNQDLILQTL